MTIDDLLAHPPDLPVVAGLARIAATDGNLVISAPPGSGKTTLVPVQMAATSKHGKVLVVQPRRVAARAGARRIASLLEQQLGDDVGIRVRGTSIAGRRIEMITPGVMLRMLQADPELAGVSCVIVDEVHERDLDADLALAFLRDVQDALRPDLRIVAMSATLAAQKIAAALDATIIDVPGDIHPVTIHDCLGPQALTAARNGAIIVDPSFLDHVAGVVRRARAEKSGSILVFLPGVREIDELRTRLADLPDPVVPLHGKLATSDQDRALAVASERIILSTAIAESSLTVPGVSVVVDAGLAREPRVDPVTGIGGLVTVHAHRASMTQRAGRAGRLGPGVAYRCLSFTRAAEFGEPEIRTADLTDALLQSAAWGAPGMQGLRLLDEPRQASVDAGVCELRLLGLVDDAGVITETGRTVAQMPISAQSGRALLDGSKWLGSERTARIVAYLESDASPAGADLSAGLRGARSDVAEQARRLRALVDRATDSPSGTGSSGGAGSGVDNSGSVAAADSLDDAAAFVVALAHPGWIARRRGGGYLLANGTGAVLPPSSPLAGEEWLAIADLGRGQGRADAIIYAAVPISQEHALAIGEVCERLVVTSQDGKVTAQRIRSLGAIELSKTPVRDVPADLAAEARLADIRARGIDALPWSETAVRLRERLAFVHRAVGEPWPDVSDTALLDSLEHWLVSDARPDVTAGLRSLLPWPEAAKFDELAPERIATPLGSAKVDYSTGKPRARLKLQEAFGWTQRPDIAGVRLTLELLSPAGRPLAVTDDLASFWAGPYAGVRADMRGRYPKHPWPEDPANAEPTLRTNRKRM